LSVGRHLVALWGTKESSVPSRAFRICRGRSARLRTIPAPGISESRIGLDATKVVDPITAALGRLSDGSSLKDLVEALLPSGTSATTASTGASRAQVANYGAVNIVIQGAGKNADEIARQVKAQFMNDLLSTTGREDL